MAAYKALIGKLFRRRASPEQRVTKPGEPYPLQEHYDNPVFDEMRKDVKNLRAQTLGFTAKEARRRHKTLTQTSSFETSCDFLADNIDWTQAKYYGLLNELINPQEGPDEQDTDWEGKP